MENIKVLETSFEIEIREDLDGFRLASHRALTKEAGLQFTHDSRVRFPLRTP